MHDGMSCECASRPDSAYTEIAELSQVAEPQRDFGCLAATELLQQDQCICQRVGTVVLPPLLGELAAPAQLGAIHRRVTTLQYAPQHSEEAGAELLYFNKLHRK